MPLYAIHATLQTMGAMVCAHPDIPFLRQVRDLEMFLWWFGCYPPPHTHF